MVRQHADVEHVGVRENDIRPLPDLPAPLARRIAVVDRRTDIRCVQLGQCARLILGKRLRRIEIERPALGLAGDSVEDRQVETKRFSGRGSGCEDQVFAACRNVERLALVHVERRERQCLAQTGMEILGERCSVRFRGGQGLDVRGLLAVQ